MGGTDSAELALEVDILPPEEVRRLRPGPAGVCEYCVQASWDPLLRLAD
jgi:hypothetical protein